MILREDRSKRITKLRAQSRNKAHLKSKQNKRKQEQKTKPKRRKKKKYLNTYLPQVHTLLVSHKRQLQFNFCSLGTFRGSYDILCARLRPRWDKLPTPSTSYDPTSIPWGRNVRQNFFFALLKLNF